MKTLRIIWKILLSMLALGIVAAIVTLGWLQSESKGTTQPLTNDKGEIIENSIAQIAYPTIGGIRQFLLIRGYNIENPILLMVHGGPGSPQAMFNCKFNAELEKHFVVVNWDQRGAGASYTKNLKDEDFTIDQFIEDTHEVTQYLQDQYGRDKIFILGHSWGSYLATRTVHQYPEDYVAYIGIGQVSDQVKSEQLSYQSVLNTAKDRGNKKAIKQLEQINFAENGFYSDPINDILVQRKWVNEFGGAAYGKTNKEIVPLFLKTLLLFPEYTLENKLNYMKGLKYTQNLLFPQMIDKPLIDAVKEVQVPFYVLQGKHDLQTVSSLAKAYFDSIQAPYKEYIEFENSAHLVPYVNEVDKFNNEVIRIRNAVMKMELSSEEVTGY